MRLRFLGQRGFSLVEIAIVLVVVGLIISGGLLGLSPVLQANKITQTNAQMDKIQQALVLYVIQNGCLPCPAVAAALTGKANDTNGAYTTSCSSAGATCTPLQGPVPWVALGLSENDVIDAYGFFIDYTPSPLLNQTTTAMVRTPPSTYPAGTGHVNNIAGASQTTAAAYVLISHGSDGSGGYTPGLGTQKGDPNGSALQTDNTAGGGAGGPCTTAQPCIQDQAQTKAAGAASYFDDIVRFQTAPVIIQSCGSNACGNPA